MYGWTLQQSAVADYWSIDLMYVLSPDPEDFKSDP
jgi:hypothetical protein